MEEMDIEQVVQYLNTAEGMKDRNEFAHGWNLGRAMEYVEQNAMDYDWFIEELRGRGLDTGIVPEPKIDVGHG